MSKVAIKPLEDRIVVKPLDAESDGSAAASSEAVGAVDTAKAVCFPSTDPMLPTSPR